MGGEIIKTNIIRPLLFKFGAVIVISLGGVLISFIGRRQFNKPKPRQSGESKNSGKSDRGGQLPYNKHEESRKITNNSIIDAISPSARYVSDSYKFLLPEFNVLVRDFSLPTIGKDDNALRNEYEREIRNLKSLVRGLSEREKTLEIQLLEYCGFKEQEAVIMELRNHLKLNNMKAKIFGLKIDSLQADNKRLNEELSDYARVVTELEASKGKIKLLKKKLKLEAEENKEHILTLKQRVHNVKSFEDELSELRNSNKCLRNENAELAQKLEDTRTITNSFSADQEVQSLKNETSKLQQQNKDLTNQIEQLQADRCADVEELVYLRWINACLRYELRNYQAAPGKTIARDLSKGLSPKSETKAKHLIMEYANREGSSETDSDFDRWSSAHSNTTDSVDLDTTNNSPSNKTENSNRAKFLIKLVRLVTGKDRPSRTSSLGSLSDPSTPRGRFGNSSQGSSRSSMDLGKLRNAKDLGMFTRTNDDSKRSSSSSEENHGNASNSKLMKYAKVFKDSDTEYSNSHKSSVSRHSSF